MQNLAPPRKRGNIMVTKKEKKSNFNRPLLYAAGFAILNVVMYFTIKKFWIGGSSFLPLIGKFGVNNAFVFALVVNIGVIIGSFFGALISKEFIFRMPQKNALYKSIFGGMLIGLGITLAPGTCTTAFVTGIPMLSVSSFLSAAGIFIGAYITYSIMVKGKEGGA